eukprot:scaffold351_cov248-Pinguiococcus_pyrenoidosus.AAC.4
MRNQMISSSALVRKDVAMQISLQIHQQIPSTTLHPDVSAMGQEQILHLDVVVHHGKVQRRVSRFVPSVDRGTFPQEKSSDFDAACVAKSKATFVLSLRINNMSYADAAPFCAAIIRRVLPFSSRLPGFTS